MGLAVGIGLGLTLGGVPSPVPASGLLLRLEYSAPALFQDAAGTVPWTAGNPVGLYRSATAGLPNAAQATSGLRPTGQANGLQSDGSTKSLQLSSAVALSGDLTFYAAGLRAAGAVWAPLGSSVGPAIFLVYSDDKFYFAPDAGAGAVTASAPWTGTNAGFVCRVTRSGSTLKLAATGMAEVTLTNAGDPSGAATFNAVTARPWDSLFSASTGRASHLYAWGRLLAAGERAGFEAYLTNRTGLTIP